MTRNLNVVENIKLFDNRYCFTLENFTITDKRKWIDSCKQNPKIPLGELEFRKSNEILKSVCSMKMDCNPITKTQITCQSREPHTESNTGLLRPKQKHVLNSDPQEEYLQGRILMTKSGNLIIPSLLPVINTSSEMLTSQLDIKPNRSSTEETTQIKERNTKTEETNIQDCILPGSERSFTFHQRNNRNFKNRNMVKKNSCDSRSTRKYSCCHLQTRGSGNLRKIRHNRIEDNQFSNMAGYQRDQLVEDQVPRATKSRASSKGSRTGEERTRKEENNKRRGTEKTRTGKDARHTKEQKRRILKTVNKGGEFDKGEDLTDLYLKLLWGLILNMLLKSLKKEEHLLKKAMTKMKKTLEGKKSEIIKCSDDFG